jgi:hypothetical protein
MITLKKYKSYFRLDDGGFSKNAPVCVRCNEEKFKECLSNNIGCDEYNKQAQERGWQNDIKGFDF